MTKHVDAETLELMAFATGRPILMRRTEAILKVAGVTFIAPLTTGGAA